MRNCGVCGKATRNRNRFCGKSCLREGYRTGLVINPGLFKPGSVSPNKGHTLESWVGEARARVIRSKMSVNSAKKAPQLARLNNDPEVLKRRLRSRAYHDDAVNWIAKALKKEGWRVFVLSEYVKEKRIPDAIAFDGRSLLAIEVETEKRWKPSHAATMERLTRLNALCGFFDETKVVFPSLDGQLEETGPGFLEVIRGKR